MVERFRRTLLGGGAKSSEGYQVRFNSRSSIEYRDATGRVLIGAEGLTGGGLALYPEQMILKSGRPPLDILDFRERVISRIRLAAEFLGIPLS